MAWDALAGRFKRQTQEDQNLGQEFKPLQTSGQSSGSASFNPTPNPTGGFGGQGGSTSGGPVSAGFVNYGDLYSANEAKAKGMAADVYKKAESKAEGAKKQVADAQQMFQQKAQANAGNWRPIGGAHGTRIESGTGFNSSDPVEGWNNRTWGETKPDGVEDPGVIRTGSDGAPTRGLQQPGASSTSAGASRYGQLFGQQTGLDSGWNPAQAESARDYHHSVRPLDAKSGAGQDYTGPKSLKESMGDEAYGKAADDIRKASEGITGLQDSGGIAEALGYAGDQTGNAAMDAGLTQTAGQSNFKRLADRYANLGKTLDDAQTNSIADAGRADAASQVAAKTWEDMLAQYEANKPKDPNAPIVIGSMGGTLGHRGDDPDNSRRPDNPGNSAGTGVDNMLTKYGGTTKGPGGQSNGLWPNGIDASQPNFRLGPDSAKAEKWESFWSTVPEATKEWLATLTPEERQKWADEQWAKLNGGE